MKLTSGRNILILRNNGRYVEIPDSENISKDIPIDAKYAFINVSMNELPAYIMIPINNLITNLYKCNVEYSMGIVNNELLAFGNNFKDAVTQVSGEYKIELKTISDFYSFLNSLDTICMVNDINNEERVEVFDEVTFNSLRIKIKSDRYNVSYDMYDRMDKYIDDYASSLIGLSSDISDAFNLNENCMSYGLTNEPSDVWRDHDVSFIMKTTKGKYEEILINENNKHREDDILSMKDSHILLYRITHTFAGDLYVALNKYEYVVLDNIKDINISIIPDMQNSKYVKGKIIQKDNEFDDGLSYEEQLEAFMDDGQCFGSFTSMSVGGMSGVISVLYQLLNIAKLALGAVLVDRYPVQIENIELQSQMGLHLAYITFSLSDNREYIDRCVLFEEDYKFSYRYIFTKILKLLM